MKTHRSPSAVPRFRVRAALGCALLVVLSGGLAARTIDHRTHASPPSDLLRTLAGVWMPPPAPIRDIGRRGFVRAWEQRGAVVPVRIHLAPRPRFEYASGQAALAEPHVLPGGLVLHVAESPALRMRTWESIAGAVPARPATAVTAARWRLVALEEDRLVFESAELRAGQQSTDGAATARTSFVRQDEDRASMMPRVMTRAASHERTR